MKKSKKPIIFGLAGAAILLVIYFSILIIANSFSHAVEQFLSMWYWILILVVGFGIQVGLYSHIRIYMREKITGATAEVAAAGGISTGSMIACCAHHITDVLPIIGFSAATLFLLKYQVPFIVLGIFSNLVGIIMMLNIIQNHKLFSKQNSVNALFKFDMKSIKNVTIILSIIVVSVVFVTAALTGENVPKNESHELSEQFYLPEKTNDGNGVSIKVKPIDFNFDKQVKLDITINTHQGSLNFDMIKISSLEDDKGREYKAINWDGSPSGGHHRSGTLTFPELKEKITYIKLTLNDIYGIPERVFIWNLE